MRRAHRILSTVSAPSLLAAITAITPIVGAEDGIEFGWGDVLGTDLANVRDQVEAALDTDLYEGTPIEVDCPGDLDGDGVVGGGDLGLMLAAWGDRTGTGDLDGNGVVGGGDLGLMLAAWGPCEPPVEGFTFRRSNGTEVRVEIPASGRFDIDGLAVRRLLLVDDEPYAEINVTRPVIQPHPVETHVETLVQLARPVPGLTRFGVAHGLVRTDLPVGTVGTISGDIAFVPREAEFRNHRELLRVDLGPAGASYARESLTPEGVGGIGLDIFEDDSFDAAGIDFDRGVAVLSWGSEVNAHPWVGFALRLDPDGPVDLSVADARLTFTVAGGTAGPDGAACLHVALEDVHVGDDGLGNEAHLTIDLGEITTVEQRVTMPLASFQEANPALDLSNLVHLKFAARDDNIPGSSWCQSGSIAILEPEFFRVSPQRLTAPNVFWTNDANRAEAAPWNPLSNDFLGQPVSAFKYFDGVFGTESWRAWDVVGRCSSIRAAGLVPHVTLELWPTDGRNPLDVMAAGEYDDFLETLFTGLRDLGGRVELTPFHESNGFWYPWSSNGRPWLVAAGFERMSDIRDAVGAHNVALGYCLISMPGNPESMREAIASIGSRGVDFIGLQGFEQGYGWDSITFNELFGAPAALLPRATGLPLMVSEWGFNPASPSQYGKGELANWAYGDVADLRLPHPPTTLHYFNVAKKEDGIWKDFRLEDENSGDPAPGVEDWAGTLAATAARPELRTEGIGRDAYETGLRMHSRIAYRVVAPAGP